MNDTPDCGRGAGSFLKGSTIIHRTIGIDLAIRGDHVAQIYDDGRPAGRPVRFRHDPGSLDRFVMHVLEGVGPQDQVQAIMKPTGMSWFLVAHRLTDASVTVIRVKGKRVKALRRYLSEHTKTDMADAQVLAAILGFGGPRLDRVHIPAARAFLRKPESWDSPKGLFVIHLLWEDGSCRHRYRMRCVRGSRLVSKKA